MKKLSLAALACLAAWPAFGQGFDVRAAALQILWSMPVAANPGAGVILDNGAMAPDGRIYLLGHVFDHGQYRYVLIPDAAQAAEPVVKTLSLGATRPATFSLWYKLVTAPLHDITTAPSVLGFAADGNGALWVGGITNVYSGLDSDSHGNAYLAKLDDSGALIWERAYNGGDYPFVNDILPMRDGNVSIAASEGGPDESWLALISGRNGGVIRQAKMWNIMDAAVLPEADSLLVAAFTSTGADSSYVQNVSVQAVSAIGQSGALTVIRPDINRDDAGFYGGLNVSANTGGAYVLSDWDDPAPLPGIALQYPELANVSAGAKLLWWKQIPDAWSNDDAGSFCENYTMATLPGGDALVACVLNEKIHLYKAGAATGDFQEAALPFPACSHGYPELMLFARPDGGIFLAGSPMDDRDAASCTWLARVVTDTR